MDKIFRVSLEGLTSWRLFSSQCSNIPWKKKTFGTRLGKCSRYTLDIFLVGMGFGNHKNS